MVDDSQGPSSKQDIFTILSKVQRTLHRKGRKNIKMTCRDKGCKMLFHNYAQTIAILELTEVVVICRIMHKVTLLAISHGLITVHGTL